MQDSLENDGRNRGFEKRQDREKSRFSPRPAVVFSALLFDHGFANRMFSVTSAF